MFLQCNVVTVSTPAGLPEAPTGTQDLLSQIDGPDRVFSKQTETSQVFLAYNIRMNELDQINDLNKYILLSRLYRIHINIVIYLLCCICYY